MAASPEPSQAWFESPLGQALLAQEAASMSSALEMVFGVQAVQVGAWGPPRLFLDHARTRRAALLAAPGQAGAASYASPAALPLQSDSIDAMLLPHTLEYAPDPHAVLREAGRVLLGEGELLVLGFEPLGSWSLRHALSPQGFPPGLLRRLSARRLADWLKLLGFETAAACRFLYAPPLARLQRGRTREVLEALGARVWPRLSGAYLLRARKRVIGMTPLRLRQQRTRGAVIGGLVEPAAQRAS